MTTLVSGELASVTLPWEGHGDDLGHVIELALVRNAVTAGAAFLSHELDINAPAATVHAALEHLGGHPAYQSGSVSNERVGGKAIYVWNNVAVEVVKRHYHDYLDVKVHGYEAELVATIRTAIAELDQETPPGSLYVLASEHGDMEFSVCGTAAAPLIRENYADAAIAGYETALADLDAKSPKGRFVLVEGVPGTGKSFLVRALATVSKAMFVLVPDGMVKDLGAPNFVSTLMSRNKGRSRSLVLVLEDADMAIIKRGGDNMPVMNALLNLTDGMLGAALDVRVVATTNAKKLEVEPALLRPGRLSAHIAIGMLTQEHASRVFERLTGGKSTWKGGAATLAEVYAAAAG